MGDNCELKIIENKEKTSDTLSLTTSSNSDSLVRCFEEDFIKVAKPLMEKMLGIKLFFEQYNKEVKGMFNN